MASQKQIDANRRNAQKSTGPITDLGKATAKFNALKHGMTASTAVLPYEDADSYAELRDPSSPHTDPPTPSKLPWSKRSRTAIGDSSASAA